MNLWNKKNANSMNTPSKIHLWKKLSSHFVPYNQNEIVQLRRATQTHSPNVVKTQLHRHELMNEFLCVYGHIAFSLSLSLFLIRFVSLLLSFSHCTRTSTSSSSSSLLLLFFLSLWLYDLVTTTTSHPVYLALAITWQLRSDKW